MFHDEHRMLKNLAHAAWVRRGRPIGSPHVDWEEAKRLLAAAEQSDQQSDHQSDQESPRSAPGGTPTDLGAELVPERSHDRR